MQGNMQKIEWTNYFSFKIQIKRKTILCERIAPVVYY